MLTRDNEENALVSVRIVFDLLRNFRPTVESEVQPFLDFVVAIYRNFPATVGHFFSQPAAPGPPAPVPPGTFANFSLNWVFVLICGYTPFYLCTYFFACLILLLLVWAFEQVFVYCILVFEGHFGVAWYSIF